jgi:pyruvate/2-oxoglutarate/acetoin dehydrogenase E1 component
MLMNFVTVAMDQIVNHAAKIRFMSGGQTSVPLTLRTMTGVGGGLGGQHSDMFEAWLAHVPGLKVVVPSNPTDWKGLLTSCIFDDNPCIFIENTQMMVGGTKSERPAPDYRVPLGKANVVRMGKDVTIVTYGRPVADALLAAAALAKDDISVEVIDLRTIVPLDEATILDSVRKTRRAVVLHEAVRSFGVGAEIASRISEKLFRVLLAPVLRVASKDTPVPFSSALEKEYMWSRAAIEAAVRETLRTDHVDRN